MKKLRNLLMMLVILVSFQSIAQSIFYTQDFETTNDWTITPNLIYYGENSWIYGTGTTGATSGSMTHSGSRSMQVWSWSGAYYSSYTNNSSYGYSKTLSRQFNFSSIPTGNVLLFKYWVVCRGEDNYDDMRVTINGIQSGVSLSSQNVWIQKTIDLTSFIGNTNVTISFEWKNDESVMRQPGARIDDIQIVYYNPLPVELLDFSTTCYGDNVLLDWSTASEQNSDKFIVEKSRGLDEWVYVTDIQAQGTSNTKHNYNYYDESWNGISYYRLRQVDLNGDEKIYGPISNECIRFDMEILPNPNNGNFNANVYTKESYPNSNIIITDMLGKVIENRNVDIVNGTNLINFELNIESGSYIIYLLNNNENILIKRFIIK